jgi:hypothetical protein
MAGSRSIVCVDTCRVVAALMQIQHEFSSVLLFVQPSLSGVCHGCLVVSYQFTKFLQIHYYFGVPIIVSSSGTSFQLAFATSRFPTRRYILIFVAVSIEICIPATPRTLPPVSNHPLPCTSVASFKSVQQ